LPDGQQHITTAHKRTPCVELFSGVLIMFTSGCQLEHPLSYHTMTCLCQAAALCSCFRAEEALSRHPPHLFPDKNSLHTPVGSRTPPAAPPPPPGSSREASRLRLRLSSARLARPRRSGSWRTRLAEALRSRREVRGRRPDRDSSRLDWTSRMSSWRRCCGRDGTGGGGGVARGICKHNNHDGVAQLSHRPGSPRNSGWASRASAGEGAASWGWGTPVSSAGNATAAAAAAAAAASCCVAFVEHEHIAGHLTIRQCMYHGQGLPKGTPPLPSYSLVPAGKGRLQAGVSPSPL